MSADLPPAEPRRGVRAGGRTAQVWDSTSLPWDAYFAVVWAGTLAYTLVSPGHGGGVRALAAGLFALLLPWYVATGRRELAARNPDGRRAARYLAGAVVLYLPAAVLVEDMRLATFGLVPQCFMFLRMRPALAAVALVNIVPVAGWAVLADPTGRDIGYGLLSSAVAIAFSAVFGYWIIRVIDRSRGRGELIAELEAGREEIARLSAAHGALTERERMSREIHDTLAQGFTSLLMLVQAVEAEMDRDPPEARRHLALMADTARRNLAEARALVARGAPADLEGSTLPDALRRLAARHEPPAVFRVTGPAGPLPPALEVVALRSCQEALANATRHAGPGARVTVVLDRTETELRLDVHDEGRGFDPAPPRPGYGLPGLRARAAEVGGSAVVHSAPGDGTTVTVRLPVAPVTPVTSEEAFR
ncbi:sensor histidine kinase [Streptomyces sp. NPDC058953]|uniref:sensor histidine kinase n=1 Tax=unclassified Streptomyces TaxID=2593676 RepID=UPI0036AB181A